MTSIELTSRGNCPLCDSARSSVHMDFPEIPVVKCAACGFIHSSRVLTGQSLTHYYENNFGSERQMQGQMVNASVNQVALGRLLDLRSVRRILDVGTGYGFLLKTLADSGHEVTGVELSRQEAAFAHNSLGVDVRNQLLADAGLQPGSFDLVTTFEVIEHIPRPVEFLQELTAHVKPGGLLLVMTDNFEGRMAQALGAGFPKWIPHSHISHFSPDTLRAALQRAGGLEVVKAMSFTPWEFLARHAANRLRGVRLTPSQAYDLRATLASEMGGGYRLFALRQRLNRLWAGWTLSDRMNGDLMYFLCRRTH
jgi:2-polyprenyl-3-methyl-5-hydroxy-6-metoxy-1,4-benzoquinol methylase